MAGLSVRSRCTSHSIGVGEGDNGTHEPRRMAFHARLSIRYTTECTSADGYGRSISSQFHVFSFASILIAIVVGWLAWLLLLPCGILIASQKKRKEFHQRVSIGVRCAALAMSSPRRQKHERITHRVTLIFKYSNGNDNNSNATNRDRKYFMHFFCS